MELENYFDFLPDGSIKIKGTRVYLEDVIERYFVLSCQPPKNG
jgi:hypothetical protein